MAQQSGYSSAEIITMQNDAVRRVNEMQRLARERVGSNPRPTSNTTPPPPVSSPPPHDESTPLPPPHTTNPLEAVGNSFTGILQKLDLDSEKIMLILLIIILTNEGADIMLILALGYILMST